MMRLSELLGALEANAAQAAPGGPDPQIRGIRYDSRQVVPGDLFVALRGANSDGHDYLEAAVDAGAAALLVEALPAGGKAASVPAIEVADTRRALAPIAARFFGHPADELDLIGVTGTNGKTSTTYLVESILAEAGQRTGLLGTVEIRFAGEAAPAVNTTPESLDLQRTLRTMRNAEVDAAILEVSSHGLELGRVSGCRFRVGAFTNLSQDHLDFHGSMDAYLASKARLFRDHLRADGVAVIHVDDPAGEKLVAVARDAGARIIRVGRAQAGADPDLRVVHSESRLSETRARLEDESGGADVVLPLLGDFNVENLAVAAGIARALGLDWPTIAAGVARCPQVPGRMERVVGTGRNEPTVVVDYAHTPDAVDKLLAAVRPLCEGRLIAVFGCGGDRDRAKRPLMAEAAARRADCAIATSDNPRTEDPIAILEEVEAGLAGLEKRPLAELFTGPHDVRAYAIEPDRRVAIASAIRGAGPSDTVVIAGKGHEDYQIIGREKLPFDDRREARRALFEREGR